MSTNPIITLRNAAMLLPLRGTDDRYFYLQGIHIEPHREKGCILVATDGIVMGIVYDEAASAPAPLTWMPSRAMVAACETYQPQTDMDGNTYPAPRDGEMIELTSPTWGDALDDPMFPKWRATLATPPEGNIWSLDARKVAQFAAVSRMNDTPLRVTDFLPSNGKKEIGPAYVFSKNAPRFFGAIMPVKMPTEGERLTALPDWLLP